MLKTNKPSQGLLKEIGVLKEQVKRANELEDRLQKLSEASFEGIFLHDQGKIIDVNDSLCSLFGYTREELLKMSAFDLAFPQDRDFVKSQVAKKAEVPYEARGLRKNGTVFFGELRAKEFLYKEKTARVVSVRDITEKKTAEKLLGQAKEDYEKLIKFSPDGILILDKKGKILFVNLRTMQLLGIQHPIEIIGTSSFDYIASQYHKSIKQLFLGLLAGQETPFMKIKIKRSTGTHIEVDYKSVIIDYRGEKAALVVWHELAIKELLEIERIRSKSAEDANNRLKEEIQVRKKVEAQLLKSQEEYRLQSAKLNSIIEASSHIVWTVDKNMALTSFNKNFSDLMQMCCGERPTLKLKMNRKSHKSKNMVDTLRTSQKYANVFNGTSEHFETHIGDANGKTVWFEIYLNPIIDSAGKVKEISGIGHDITIKKEAEEKIKQSLSEKDVLLKEVHHRVKNNLQVISSILNLQSSYTSDKKVIDLLKESQNRIKTMSFIHESLYQAKNFSTVNFGEYIHQLTSNLFLSYGPQGNKVALKRKIKNVVLNLDLAIPCGLIVNELVSNALKYAFVDNKSGELTISLDEDKKKGIKICVSDNGSGLSKKINFRNTKTLGLQLVIVLVNQLKGKIQLDNKKGAKFTITFNRQ